jgi:peptidyl-prolyl cis-trans isomerase D
MTARSLLVAAAALSLAACSLMRDIGLAENESNPDALREGGSKDEPAHVVVQHVLVSFEGAKVPGVTRTQDEAKALAQRVLAEAKSGRDFAELVRLYTDDRGSDGTYAMANWGVPTESGETERRRMVRGFGTVAFTLGVGEVGLCEYDPNASPFGWHVVKRVR